MEEGEQGGRGRGHLRLDPMGLALVLPKGARPGLIGRRWRSEEGAEWIGNSLVCGEATGVSIRLRRNRSPGRSRRRQKTIEEAGGKSFCASHRCQASANTFVHHSKSRFFHKHQLILHKHHHYTRRHVLIHILVVLYLLPSIMH